MRYSKRMKFTIYDLLATKVCENERRNVLIREDILK